MKSLESKAQSGSILNTCVLTDADGTEVEGKEPALDESFLKSLTRNFTFSVYIRAGFQVNGNGGGGNFNFAIPDFFNAGRLRLGNENDTYMELTWMQAHMLGDSPDVMDVSMTITPAIRYVQSRTTFTGSSGGLENSGNDFGFILRQAFLEAKNVFKGAPEITFWGGERFYDRWNTDPEDYFWLDTSGYGAGVYNIDVGIGKLWLAWIDGIDANMVAPDIGTLDKQTFDVRLKNIDVPGGQLMAVLIGNVERGGTFTQDFDSSGDTVNLTNPLRVGSAWGIGGGLVYTTHFGAGGANNSLTVYALFGRGATNFSASDDLNFNGLNVAGAESLFLLKHPGLAPGQNINVGSVIDRSHTFRAGFQFYINPVPVFSLGVYGDWEQNDAGTFFAGTTASGQEKIISGLVNDFQAGIRPAYWLADNLAIQGQAGVQYESNTRNTSGTNSFGRNGTMGIFTIAPTIKPKGGYYTKPEFRIFATYALWSNSLKGVTTPAQEDGENNDFQPPYTKSTHGFLFGTQVEWFY